MSHTSSLQKSASPWMTVSGLGETKVLSVVPGPGVGAFACDMGLIPLSVRRPWFKLWDDNHLSFKLCLCPQLSISGLHSGEK